MEGVVDVKQHRAHLAFCVACPCVCVTGTLERKLFPWWSGSLKDVLYFLTSSQPILKKNLMWEQASARVLKEVDAKRTETFLAGGGLGTSITQPSSTWRAS